VSRPAQTKGISFLHVRHYTERRFNDAGWSKVLGLLDAADRATIAATVAVGWYDVALYARLLNALERAHGDGRFTLIADSGAYQAERDLNVVFRMLLRLGTPAYVVDKTAEYWNRMQTTGTWKIERRTPNCVYGWLADWGIVDAAMCAELVAYIKRLIELVGGKDVVVEHPECRVKGHRVCMFTLTWK
jgi:hypothetical protein